MLILSIISVILFVMCLWYFAAPFNPGFVSMYDDLFKREPFESSSNLTQKIISGNYKDMFSKDLEFEVGDFWVYLNKWMMLTMITAIVIIIITRILGMRGKLKYYKADMVVYLCVILSFAVYYMIPILFADYTLEFKRSVLKSAVYSEYTVQINPLHLRFFITAGYSLFMIFICLRHNKRKVEYEKKLLSVDETYIPDPVDRKIVRVLSVIAAVLFFGLLLINIKTVKICLDYKSNYGEYAKADHAVRTDLEEHFLGNYQNDAVMTDEGLYFVGDVPSAVDGVYTIKRLEPSGERITSIYSGDILFRAIGYCDGYLYGATYEGIYQIDPESGECKLIIEHDDKNDIKDFCVVDNRMYYQEGISSEEAKVRTGEDRDYDVIPSVIKAADISEGNVSEPYLYASDINTKDFRYYNGFLLTRYIMNEKHNIYYGANPQYSGDKIWIVDSDGYNNRNILKLFVKNQTFPNEMEDIGCINYEDGVIYFIKLKEDGFDVCKCSPDMSDIEVLDTYTDGFDYTKCDHKGIRMGVSDKKIVVIINEEPKTSLRETRDALTYVTDK